MFFAFWAVLAATIGKWLLEKVIKAIIDGIKLEVEKKKAKKKAKAKVKEIFLDKDPKSRAKRLDDLFS